MTEWEQRVSSALNRAVDSIQPDLLDKIQTAKAPVTAASSSKRKRPSAFRLIPAGACLALGLALAVTAPLYFSMNKKMIYRSGTTETADFSLSAQYGSDVQNSTAAMVSSQTVSAAVSSATEKTPSAAKPSVSSAPVTGGGPSINGVLMLPYDRYNGNYYKLGTNEPAIQKNIECHLYGEYYKIRGENPVKTIAIFINEYYRRLTYAFPDSIQWNGKPYLINANEIMENSDKGAVLGKSGGYIVYSVKGYSGADAVSVNIPGYGNFIAYQMPSSVTFNGVNYALRDERPYDNIGEGETCLGTADGYKLYSVNDIKPPQAVLVRLTDKSEIEADATTPTLNEPLPESLYGSVFESMGACYADTDWAGHGFYYINDNYNTDAKQAAFAKLVGPFLGNSDSYPIYTMKGADPAKSILAKNNKVWMEYDYIFPDTVTFNGQVYVSAQDDTYGKGVRGGAIGKAGPYTVYRIEGVDPSKAVIVEMYGSTPGASLSTTITFVRK